MNGNPVELRLGVGSGLAKLVRFSASTGHSCDHERVSVVSYKAQAQGESMPRKPTELLPGTLDLLILKAISLQRQHGCGVLLRIRQISGEALNVPQGSLYPALNRLEHQGLIESEWGESANRRRAKYYRLTRSGKRRLREEKAGWERLTVAMAAALRTTPDEV